MSKRTSTSPRVRKHLDNAHLLENLVYMGEENVSTSIELIQYDKTQISERAVRPDEKLKELIKPDCVNWFRITGISDAGTTYNICKAFGIPRFDVKDLLSGYRVTKVITHDTNTFILMSGAYISEDKELIIYQNAFILGDNYVVSFQERPSTIFNDAKDAIKEGRVMIREKDEDYLLYILLNCLHSSFNDAIIKLNNRLNEMEDRLIDDDTENINVMRFISRRKKDASSLRRIIAPLREEYINLLHNTNKLIKPENIMYFEDFDDRLRTSLDDLLAFRESVSSLSDLYFNNNNLRLNNVIKKLTIVSTIFIPLTFMVGVWGMNFDYMPELRWAHGYLFAWGIMLLIVILAVFYLKRKRWF
ncbi:magnesium/cobalt transporter CorA [Dysgonomonas macrotermitis]|uniref:Magnesium transport protein CorA n=1 Tax=Dysgonomonas macrotermitis TaxID=1346286 RepID=A0A1M4UGA2_9BACT|nr:magnesium/cobalt transporter CorA [Dysgonomonas macrotermitis]SHE55791.1 magnesium transporter [Dysgonomonas macrotermitis]